MKKIEADGIDLEALAVADPDPVVNDHVVLEIIGTVVVIEVGKDHLHAGTIGMFGIEGSIIKGKAL